MSHSGRVEVERLGGLAGFGLPGSRLRSRGELDLAQLSSADSSALDALFGPPQTHADPSPDGFRYRLTRHDDAGTRVIEVPETDVPAALRDCVKDSLD
jgi:hypothetical protein